MPAWPKGDAREQDVPQSERWRDQMLDAAIIAAATVARADGVLRPTARMALLVATRRAGLVDTPPQCDVLARLGDQFTRLAHPAAARRAMVRAMNPFVGTSWAETIVAIASDVAGDTPVPDAVCALAAIRRALGLHAADAC